MTAASFHAQLRDLHCAPTQPPQPPPRPNPAATVIRDWLRIYPMPPFGPEWKLT